MKQFTEETMQNLSESNAEAKLVLQKRREAFNIFQEAPLEKLELFKKYSKKDSYEFPDTEFKQGELEFEMPKVGQNVGINILPISEALGNHTFAPIIEKVFDNEDKFSAFTNAFFNTGYLVYVPNNVRLLSPIFFKINVDSPIISKNIVVGAPGSRFTVYEKINSVNESPSVYSTHVDIFAEENSHISHTIIQNLNNETMSLQNRNSYTQANSYVNFCSGLFGGQKIRTRTNINLQKTGASGKNFEIIFGNRSQKFDVTSKIHSTASSTVGESHSRGIFSGKSRALIKGRVVVENGAKKSSTYLTQHGMLLSKDASADTIPCLEILEQDVLRATHSASIAPIDEDQIFYLLSRGLEENKSRKLIVSGFLETLLKNTELKNTREEISKLIESKLGEEDVQ